MKLKEALRVTGRWLTGVVLGSGVALGPHLSAEELPGAKAVEKAVKSTVAVKARVRLDDMTYLSQSLALLYQRLANLEQGRNSLITARTDTDQTILGFLQALRQVRDFEQCFGVSRDVRDDRLQQLIFQKQWALPSRRCGIDRLYFADTRGDQLVREPLEFIYPKIVLSMGLTTNISEHDEKIAKTNRQIDTLQRVIENLSARERQ